MVTFSSIAVPLTNGFIGEFLILLGAFDANRIFAALGVVGVILGAVYMLWAVKRLFFGQRGSALDHHTDEELEVNGREIAIMIPLVILIFWMGVFPNDFLKWSKASLENLVQNRTNYQLSVEE